MPPRQTSAPGASRRTVWIGVGTAVAVGWSATCPHKIQGLVPLGSAQENPVTD